MPTVPTDQAGLKKYIEEQKAAGKTESTSKSLAKAVIRLKEFSPGEFDLEAGGGREAILQRGVEDPTPVIPPTPGVSGVAGSGGSATVAGQAGFDLNSVFSQAMNAPEIKELESEVTAKKDALTKALGDINDNPFYSEATRTGRIAKLEERANREINDLVDQLNLKRADAQTQVNIALQQYDINRREYQDNLNRLNFLISSGSLLNANSEDISQIVMSTGLSSDMIAGIQQQMRLAQTNPQVITSTDETGNVSLSVIDGNTGEIINQTSLGNVGKGTTAPDTPGTFPGASTFLNEQFQTLAPIMSEEPIASYEISSLW